MCGICGILYTQSCEHVIEKQLSDSLNNLKHRGYDGCGISINLPYIKQLSRRRIVSTKQFIQQFQLNDLSDLSDSIKQSSKLPNKYRNQKCNCSTYRISGIAHTRYKTAGGCSLKNTQPVFNKDNTIALVHNGQVEVYKPTEDTLNESESTEHLFDSKYILEVFDDAFKKTKSIFRSIKRVHDTVKGSYACVLMIKDLGIVGFRDPSGIRPLVFGIEKDNKDLELFSNVKNVECAIFASESVVLEDTNFKFVRDVKPGESIFVDLKGNVRYGNYCVQSPPDGFVLCGESRPTRKYTPCLFEYIYLADENSIIDGIRVGKAREIMGELLYENLNRYFGSIDVIAPVPNTPVKSTKRLAELLHIKYSELLYLPTLEQLEDSLDSSSPNSEKRQALKDSRTFILPTQNKRELAVKDKFRINVDSILDCQDKVLALVDDSIVRGTTMSIIVKMIRELVQPKKLILVSLAPPIRYENVYGIDIANRNSLVAHNRTLAEIAKTLGADEVIYGNLDNITHSLKAEAKNNGVEVDGYETSVFKNK